MVHLKRLAAPDFWPILRKASKWAIHPSPGPHPLQYCIPLAYILREILGYARTMKEAKIILAKGLVKRDKVIVRDHKFPVGFMDTLELEGQSIAYRLLPYRGTPLVCAKIPLEETNLKICKIVGKRTIKGGKIQLNLHDGRNLLIDPSEKDKYKINDSILIELPSQKIKEVIKFEVGNLCLIYRGVNAGSFGVLKKINEVIPRKNSILEIEDSTGNTIRTNINYAIPIGYDKPLIKMIESEEDYVKPVIYARIHLKEYEH